MKKKKKKRKKKNRKKKNRKKKKRRRRRGRRRRRSRRKRSRKKKFNLKVCTGSCESPRIPPQLPFGVLDISIKCWKRFGIVADLEAAW